MLYIIYYFSVDEAPRRGRKSGSGRKRHPASKYVEETSDEDEDYEAPASPKKNKQKGK